MPGTAAGNDWFCSQVLCLSSFSSCNTACLDPFWCVLLILDRAAMPSMLFIFEIQSITAGTAPDVLMGLDVV